MSAAKIQVGKVYTLSKSKKQVYVFFIERTSKRDRLGKALLKMTSAHYIGLDKAATTFGKCTLEALGDEVIMPFNKAEWGIKTIYKILLLECKFFSKKFGYLKERNSKAKPIYDGLRVLTAAIESDIVNKVRNVKKYSEYVRTKNSLVRTRQRTGSLSRGAAQRERRFDSSECMPIPFNKNECLPPFEEYSLGYYGSPDSLYLRWCHSEDSPRNHMDLTFGQFEQTYMRNCVHVDNVGQVSADYCYDDSALNRFLQFYAVPNFTCYLIENIGGQEFFPNASPKDESHYIKPYGWPELYKGRIGKMAEIMALRGKRNKRGLNYVQWLSRNPRYIKKVCSATRCKKNGLGCIACSQARYSQWMRC